MTIKTRRFRRLLLWVGLPALAAGLFIAPRAYAFGPFRGHGHHAPRSAEDIQKRMGHRIEYLLDEVDASDAQRKQVDAIVGRAAPQLFEIMREGRAARTAIKDALLATTLDEARIATAQEQLDVLADRATDLGIGTLTEIAKVLTPVQRKQIADELAAMHP